MSAASDQRMPAALTRIAMPMPSTIKAFLRLPWLTIACLGVLACGDDRELTPEETVTVIEPDAGCDDAGCASVAAVCGDGTVNAGIEECDDGNVTNGDGCSSSCALEECGNGAIDPGETCEPPGTQTCTANCILAQSSCGNGKVEAELGETCEDGNDAKGDGCRNCRTECGDGLLDREIGEECEPQYSPKDSAGVSLTCTNECRRKPFCGDGKVNSQAGEECDPVNGTTCVNNCKRAPSSLPDAGVGTCVPDVDAGVLELPVENVVPNPAFTTDLGGWANGVGVVATYVGNQGATAPGSARITFAAGTGAALSVDGITRCVAIPAGRLYEFTAQYLVPASQPMGVTAFPVLLLFANGSCSGMPLNTGPAGTPPSFQTEKWLPYKRGIDTTKAGTPGTQVSVSIKLGVVVPAGKSGSALWDDVSLRSTTVGTFDPNCGNCTLDKGETCDDGNHRGSDGCSPFCQQERNCGNGVVEPGEACDEGKVNFIDARQCTPSCTNKTPCDQCALAQCRPQVDVCLGLQGFAEAGPGKGESRAALCERLRSCVQVSGCNGATAIASRPTLNGMPGQFLENCYCGTSGAECLKTSAANGSCKAQVEAALESDSPTTLFQRMGGAEAKYPIFAALSELLLCQDTKCAQMCVAAPACGNGAVQERPAAFASDFQLLINGKRQMCVDALTPSGRGCSFEECDGSSMTCDENCFVLKCGNGLRQTGEQCDDGNVTSGDGCAADCKAEFTCGDSQVADKFGEQCDPPNTGKVCRMTEFTANPSSCGCGSTCEYKVCGNNVVQEGEDCDPPNGTTCGVDCKRVGLSECVACIGLVTDNPCGKALLEGIPDMPGFETGCLNDKPCFDLLQCTASSKCGTTLGELECYCGPASDDLESCEKPDFSPRGACKEETKAAFTSQFGKTATNMDVVSNYAALETAAGRPASMAIAQVLAGCTIFQRGELARSLAASGVAQAQIASCVAACGAQ